VWRKWGLTSYSAHKFILYRVERGQVLRARGLPKLLGVLRVAQARKICRNPFEFDGVFWALVRSRVGALPEFYEFWQRADSRVPLLYRDSSLLRYPWHYLRVGDLPIIISRSFTFLCYLCIYIPYSRIGVCLVIYTVPCLRTIEYSGIQCGDYYLIPWRLTALIMRKILDSAVDEVSEALFMHVAPLAIQIIVVSMGVTVLLELRNPPCSWISTVVPSLPGFNIAPCVDSFLCYRLIRWHKSILQDSPKI
jgi:hypothetical protein